MSPSLSALAGLALPGSAAHDRRLLTSGVPVGSVLDHKAEDRGVFPLLHRLQLHRIVVSPSVRLMGRQLVLGDETSPGGNDGYETPAASGVGHRQLERHPGVSQSSAFMSSPSAPQTSGKSADATRGSSLPRKETRFRVFCNELGKNCKISDNWGGPSRQQIEQAKAPSLEQRLPPVALVLSERWRLRLQSMKRDANFL